MEKIAVLIPCYNEEITIEKVIKDFKKELPTADIYVYDNNSKDNTAKIAKENGAIVKHEYRQGKGNVVRSMFRDIEADIYVMVDGDDTYPAEEVHKLIEPIRNNEADMVIGDRLTNGTYQNENKRHFHEFGNNIVRDSINKLFKSNLKDIMTGYRVFNKIFVKNMPVMSPKFEIETEMTLHALDKKFIIKEIPIIYRDRPEGSVSKLNTFSDGFKVLKTIIRLFKDYKPLRFFTTIAFVLFVIALIFFVPVVGTYVSTGLVPNFPTLIVCGFVVIAALQCFFTGLTLSTIVAKNRQDFEFKRITVEEDLKDKLNK